jgi:hypothetical protein
MDLAHRIDPITDLNPWVEPARHTPVDLPDDLESSVRRNVWGGGK